MGISRPIAGVQPFAELFQGATTTVYKGYERSLDRFVLLKVLRPEYSQDEVLVRRFEEEARLIAKVQHPNVVSIYSFGQEEDDTYIIAEFVEGVNLRDLITAGTLPPEIAVFALLQVARGLQAAHARGIFHRDIKPENILISFEGVVKLTDFGMASLGEEIPEVRGTLGYLAPEQVLGEPFTRASDLFSLGATFFEMLAGRPAFPGADANQRFDGIVNADPLPFLEANHRIPVAITQICRRLLQKDPRYRYPDAAALASDLEGFLRFHAPSVGTAILKAYIESPESYTTLDLTTEALPVPTGDGHPLAVSVPSVSYTVVYDPDTGQGSSIRTWLARPRNALRGGAALLLILLIGFLVIASVVQFGRRTQIASAELSGDSLLTAGTGGGRADVDSLSTDSLLFSLETGSALPQPTQRPNRSGPRRSVEDARTPSISPSTRGSLAVDCSPWCTVLVNGDSVGVTPMRTPVSLRPGSYRVELRNPVFPIYRTTVLIEPGDAKRLNVVLFERVGQIDLKVNPWAEVLVDGKLEDVTPLKAPLILSPGRHRLTLRNPNLGTWETEIEVKAGEARTLQFNLHRLLGK